LSKIIKLGEMSLTQKSTILFLITLLVKILGLFREILIAAYIGMNQATDAYNIAVLATSIITAVSGIAIGSALIPVLAGISPDSKKERENFFLNVFWIMYLLLCLQEFFIYL